LGYTFTLDENDANIKFRLARYSNKEKDKEVKRKVKNKDKLMIIPLENEKLVLVNENN